jgi:hypothetical protein
LEDLAAFVARVEAIPAPVYEGLVRNASFREEQVCSLFYLDTMGSRALGSVEALERWIAHLLARKLTVRTALPSAWAKFSAQLATICEYRQDISRIKLERLTLSGCGIHSNRIGCSGERECG